MPDDLAACLAAIRERSEVMREPEGDCESSLFTFAASVADDLRAVPGWQVQRGGACIDVWTGGRVVHGQPTYRVWVELGRGGHLSSYGGNLFDAAASDLPRVIAALEAVMKPHRPGAVVIRGCLCEVHESHRYFSITESEVASVAACPDCTATVSRRCAGCDGCADYERCRVRAAALRELAGPDRSDSGASAGAEPESGVITLCAAHSVRNGPRSAADLEEWKACPDCVSGPWKPGEEPSDV